ncbi:KH domain-containing protein [Candidatus Woesearchaeota archaeon]|nr:KH domain-containing protein [Candidatus Woesearchaeota archaeon]
MSSEIIAKEKDIVVPGEVLAVGMDFLPSNGTYRNGDKIMASTVGLVNIKGKVIKLIPLRGKYNPKVGDTVIGKVSDILFSGWKVDIGCTNDAVLPLQEASSDYIQRGADLTMYFDLGDYITCKITNVTSQKLIDISANGPGLRKLGTGRLMNVSCNKVPRIIGKQGSMVNTIKEHTGSKIIVGQNGVVWVKNEDPVKELLTAQAIKMIEDNAHTPGLTDKVTSFLSR